jgi:hypothetical protein
MDVYDMEPEHSDAPRRKDARSVDAWVRAAAYAAGDEPEAVLPVMPQLSSNDESLLPAREYYEPEALALSEALAVRAGRDA